MCGYFLLQGIFPTQGLNPGLLYWQVDSLASEPPRKPWLLGGSDAKESTCQYRHILDDFSLFSFYLLLNSYYSDIGPPGLMFQNSYAILLSFSFQLLQFKLARKHACDHFLILSLLSFFFFNILCLKGSPGGSVAKSLPDVQVLQFWSLGPEDPLKKKMATHSSILA